MRVRFRVVVRTEGEKRDGGKGGGGGGGCSKDRIGQEAHTNTPWLQLRQFRPGQLKLHFTTEGDPCFFPSMIWKELNSQSNSEDVTGSNPGERLLTTATALEASNSWGLIAVT